MTREKLRRQREDKDHEKVKVVCLNQKMIDGWRVGYGRSWFTGPATTVFARLQDFLFVRYYLSRLRFRPFKISPRGVVSVCNCEVPTREGPVYVHCWVCPMTGCIKYAMKITPEDSPRDCWEWAIDPLEG